MSLQRTDQIDPKAGSIDAIAVAKASQAMCSEIEMDRLMETLMRIAMEIGGAERGCLLLTQGGELTAELQGARDDGSVKIIRPVQGALSGLVPETIVESVRRTREKVKYDPAREDNPFSSDTYLLQNRPLSLICLPIVRQDDFIGLLYLESLSLTDAFTADMVAVLEVLAGQVAISLDNAKLYERMQQENLERRRAEERYRDLLETAPDAMVIVNQQGEICLVNSQTERMFGYSREELYGHRVEILIPERYRERHVQHVKGYMEMPRVRPMGIGLDLSGLTSDGGEFPIDLSLSPLYTDTGLLVTARVRDITEQKTAEKALRESEQRYRQLNATLEQRVKDAVEELNQKNRLLMVQSRQAIMGEMISNIAHQWRQPLNTLGLLAQELKAMHRLGKDSGEYIDASVSKTMEIIQYMSKTIDDFRFFFRPAKEKQAFSVLDVLDKTMSLLHGSFQTLGLRTLIEPSEELQVHGYPNEFSQVLLNILINARDAFVLNQISEVREPVIRIKLHREQGRVVLTITDNAGGISEEIIDRIFEPYFTTKGPEQGTGVGLFMSKTIIEKNMNGALTARNVGEGAQFRIELPEWSESAA